MKTIKKLFARIIAILLGLFWDRIVYAGSFAEDTPLYQPDMMSTVNTRDRVDFDFRTEIYKDRMSVAFVTILARELELARMRTSEMYYFEQISRTKIYTPTTSVSAGAANTAVTWTFSAAEAKGLVPGMTLRMLSTAESGIISNEVIITAKPSSTTFTIMPVMLNGTTDKGTPATVANTSKLYQVTTRFARGSAAVSPTAVKTVKRKLVTGIRKTAFSLDNTLDAEKMYGIAEMERLRIEGGNDHAEDLEAAALWNKLQLEPSESQNTSDYQGIIMKIRENSPINVGYTTYDFADLLGWSNNLFKARRSNGGVRNHKLGLCNGAALSVAWELSQAKKWEMEDVTVYGVPGVKRLRFPKGYIDLLEHPQVTDIYDDETKPYICALDLRYIGNRDFRPTKLEMNVQTPGVDGKTHQFITENAVYAAMTGAGLHSEFRPL